MLIRSILDVIFPRFCVMCGKQRLTVEEEIICLHCNASLPRTFNWQNPTDNTLAMRFWGRVPVEKATAYFHYQAHSDTANLIYSMKYNGRSDVAKELGAMMGRELKDFLSDIDLIVPVPLSRSRLHSRGYNQTEEMAKGMLRTTGIPYARNLLLRSTFILSQTKLSHEDRNENVEGAFMLNHGTLRIVTPKGGEKIKAPLVADYLKGKHILIIDDVITTGSTTSECAKQLLSIPNIRISIAGAATAS